MSSIKTEITGTATATTTATAGGGAFQLPINMSVTQAAMPSNAAAAATTTTTTTRNNISVTNIKCEVDEMLSSGGDTATTANGNHIVPVIATTATTAAATTATSSYFNGGGAIMSHIGGSVGGIIRIPVTKTEAQDSDSETELTNIENLKVTRRASSSAASSTAGSAMGNGVLYGGGAAAGGGGGGAPLDLHNKNGPRPMSWEGELSETETNESELMETENSLSNCGPPPPPPSVIASTAAALGVAVIKSETPLHGVALGKAHAAAAHTAAQQQQQQQHYHNATASTTAAAATATALSAHSAMQQALASTQQQRAAAAIKPELVEQISVEIHHNNHNYNNGCSSSSSSNNHNSQSSTPNNHQHHHHHHHQQQQQQQQQQHHHHYATPPHGKLKLAPTQSDPINLKYEPADSAHNSPLLTGGVRHHSKAPPSASSGAVTSTTQTAAVAAAANTLPLPANPSPDSAIHSVYTHSSPSQSPLTSRHAPYTPSLSRNNSDASHSSCYSYSSEFSPTHSPIQGRHATPGSAVAAAAAAAAANSLYSTLHHAAVLYRPISLDSGVGGGGANGSILPTPSTSSSSMEAAQNLCMDTSTSNSSAATAASPANSSFNLTAAADGLAASAAGISRQQLINSPCPICGDKISGFHYGIFSCESCKGFFKRTVQNRKNYVCVRGGPCPVSIATRKKCPACRFEKCLQKGMKLEAIREDRTRGGRSTYQCSYTLPNALLSPLLSPEHQMATATATTSPGGQQQQNHNGSAALLQHGAVMNGYHGGASSAQALKCEQDATALNGGNNGVTTPRAGSVPVLLQEIMDVEHLWQYNEAELARLNQPLVPGAASAASAATQQHQQQMTNPLLASAGLGENTNPDLIAHLCNVADHRLYKIVKWCKSLPLFKNISIDDQICLLINSWCELLLFSCCFRSIDSSGEIKMSQGKTLTLTQAKSNGLQACIERMLNLTDHLRRLRVDRYEYVALKVIVLLQSDTSELQEPVKVRECQEKALQSLQTYTLAHYPDTPSKFGELLLRIPELQRTCQLGKEMLTIKSRDGGDFNLLMELLRGEH